MSNEQSPAAPAPGDAMAIDTNSDPRKSYRRKYRKIMVKFEERMRESTGLFKDEQRIFDISQRLAEQTDQILQLLLELNDSPEVPSALRYNLKPAGREFEVKPKAHENEQRAHEAIRLGRYQVQTGESSAEDYQDRKKDLLDTVEFAPSLSYERLSKLNPATSLPREASADPSSPSGAGYITIRHEEQYLHSLDAFIAGKSTNPRAHAANNLGHKGAERTTDREREMQLRNPVSVYNWLRKHQPQVFLQDHEASTEKGSKASGSRSSKRTAVSKELKSEPDWYDDEGIAVDNQGSASRGKRKRNDDTAFRPKGGKPGHGNKKRKDESGKRSKRSSIDARAS